MLDLTIKGLEKELRQLQDIKESIRLAEEEAEIQIYLEQNSHLVAGLLEASQASNLAESISQVAYFELKTLEFGIDSARFQLDWFKKLRQELELAEENKEV